MYEMHCQEFTEIYCYFCGASMKALAQLRASLSYEKNIRVHISFEFPRKMYI